MDIATQNIEDLDARRINRLRSPKRGGSSDADCRNILKSLEWGHYVVSLVMLRAWDILPLKYQKYIFFESNFYTYYML